jgi:hypothetical protein
MRMRKRRALEWDALESRTYLSSGIHHHPEVTINLHRMAVPTQRVAGQLHGNLNVVQALANNGVVLSVSGTGVVKPLGLVRVGGGITETPSNGRFTGDISLSNARGAIILHLEAAYPSFPKRVPNIHVLITSASGDFSALEGEGTAFMRSTGLSVTGAGRFSIIFHTVPLPP